MRKLTEAEKAEVWDRWQGGEAMRSFARLLGRESSSVRTMIEDCGGVRPDAKAIGAYAPIIKSGALSHMPPSASEGRRQD